MSSVDVAVSPVEKFQEYLATKDMRLTRERMNFVEEVFSSHEHFDADLLIERVSRRKDGRSVSRPTVYRTLTLLEEAGLIRKVARQSGRDVYEHDYGYAQHDHFICSRCGELTEFSNERIRDVVEEIAAEYGFRLSHHRLEAHGICAECSSPPRRSHRKLDMI
ncbi:MAG TPA: Fur family transcriptional regulator [Planctomycetaceae bacterium]|nr:Fur family transcriptional regulator [Planctomycetaceae bacterium]